MNDEPSKGEPSEVDPERAALGREPGRELTPLARAKENWVMAAATAPIKVDIATDELVSHAAHIMSRSKKDIVDAAAREYIDAHRDEVNAGIKAALGQFNGSDAAAVS